MREHQPNAIIVFYRFHVMKLYSDLICNVRAFEFREADADGKQIIKGSLYLSQGNRQCLHACGERRSEEPLYANRILATVYTLKEQLQAFTAPLRRPS